MKITEALLDATRTLGTKLWVVNVTPIYEYRDHRRTENVLGYRYETVLAERKMDKIGVDIDGPALLDPPNGYYEVAFEGLEARIAWKNGDYYIAAKATGVKVLKDNT